MEVLKIGRAGTGGAGDFRNALKYSLMECSSYCVQYYCTTVSMGAHRPVGRCHVDKKKGARKIRTPLVGSIFVDQAENAGAREFDSLKRAAQHFLFTFLTNTM